MHQSRLPSRGSHRNGFTLLEVIIVVVIIAILASLITPRFAGTTRRQFQLVADRVADLLTIFAQRDNLSQTPVGLSYDESRRSLTLVLLVSDKGEEARRAEWRPDPFAQPVELPEIIDDATLIVAADGEVVDIRDWPLCNSPGEDRPEIEISFESADRQHSMTLILSPYAVSPRRLDDEDRYSIRQRRDLDAAGRSQEDW